ncbi:MAG: hypothetical protein FK732_11855 [Asgard group archaeon]|nr:hypothetical protein [Asgard group archaeon]
MSRMKGMKKTALILVISVVVLLYNIGTYNLIAEKGIDILNPMYNEGQPDRLETNPTINQEIDPPLGNQTNLPRFNTIFTMMAYNFPIEIAIVFFAEMVFSSLVRSDRKKMNFLRLLILLGSAAALTTVNSLNHYFLVWPAIHDWPIHAGHTYNDTSVSPYVLRPLYGEQEEPINKNYSLSNQSWILIQEVNLSKNQITKYQWVSDSSVQGSEVTKEQFLVMQGQNSSERSAYFETIGYTEGIKDNGKTSIDSDGSLYFVFFNPNSIQANIDLTYTYQYTFFSPAVTILVLIIAMLIILGIHFLAFRFIQQLNIVTSGVSLLMPAIYYTVILSTLARQTKAHEFFEKTGDQFMFALVLSGVFLLTIVLVLIWNLTLMGTQRIVSTKQAEWQQRYDDQ